MIGLVLPAAVRNRREGITGCLWTGERSFVQVIEGDEKTVHDLMVRIVADQRHHSLRMLMNCSARMRLFDTWSLKWVKEGRCVEVEGLADAIVQRAPKAAVEAVAPGHASEPRCSVAPALSRMAQIVIALVSAESELL